LTGDVSVAIGGKLKAGSQAAVAPGSKEAKSTLGHAWKGINASPDFPVEVDDLLMRLSFRHHRNIDGEDMAGVKAGPRILKGNQRFQKHASSGEKQEGSSNLYYGENSETPVGAAGYPDARVG
jgi:hypothetical protein